MNTSGYVWNDTFEKRAARPHSASGQPENNRKRTPDDAIRYAAAGDLHTTPSEYAKFLIEVIDPKPADGFRLGEATLNEMARPHVRVSELKSWGLGWEIPHIPGGGMIQHGGTNYGFHAYACASVKRKSGVIIMTNGENGWKLIAHPSYLDPMVKLVTG
jgi:Beta-lactamase